MNLQAIYSSLLHLQLKLQLQQPVQLQLHTVAAASYKVKLIVVVAAGGSSVVVSTIGLTRTDTRDFTAGSTLLQLCLVYRSTRPSIMLM